MNLKGRMKSSNFLIIAAIIVQLTHGTVAQYDDDKSERRLRLQDIENEHNRNAAAENLPSQVLHPPHADSAFNHNTPNNAFHAVPQNVRPLDQKITAVKPVRELESFAASNFNFGISQFAHNGLEENANEGDIDADIVTYSHDSPSPPFPFNIRRPQLELLSSGGAGYNLMSADVLVPPFRQDIPSNGQRPLAQLTPERYVTRPFGTDDKRRPPSQYAANDGSPSTPSALAAGNYLASNDELPSAPAGTIEYSSGYLPVTQHSPQRPTIQYGSPNADFRRPSSVHAQSNQLTYAPVRPGSDSLMQSFNVPYPPSFISITTRRPDIEFIGNGVPQTVRPLGRSLGHVKPFRPSAVDPVPDLFANRQSKSLIDSYIPSWIVARMIEQQQRNSGDYTNAFINDAPYNRHFKRSNSAHSKKDNIEMESSDSAKIVKKSLNAEMASGLRK